MNKDYKNSRSKLDEQWIDYKTVFRISKRLKT